jgi:hypothetical protein
MTTPTRASAGMTQRASRIDHDNCADRRTVLLVRGGVGQLTQHPRATCERKERVMASRSTVQGGTDERRREKTLYRIALSALTPSSIAAHRTERPWLALVGLPLEMIATALTGQWIAWPLLVALSWWWTPLWRWSWALTLQEGIFGAEWAYAGATALGTFHARRLMIAAPWIGVPVLLAIAAARNRYRMDRPEFGVRPW